MNPRQVLPERDLPGLRSPRSGPSMLSEGLRQYVTQLNSQIGRSPRRTLQKKMSPGPRSKCRMCQKLIYLFADVCVAGFVMGTVFSSPDVGHGQALLRSAFDAVANLL